MDDENGFIILEDASSLGFYNISRQHTLDWTGCTAILTSLAKFHAISFAYKDQKKEEFDKLADSLKETIFTADYWHWYKNFHVRIENRTLNKIFKNKNFKALFYRKRYKLPLDEH